MPIQTFTYQVWDADTHEYLVERTEKVFVGELVARSAAMDLGAILQTASVGSLGANNNGWSIFVGLEPESPDKAITLYDSGGFEPNAAYLLDWPHVQIRVRGMKNAYAETYQQAYAVKEALLGLPAQDVGDYRYDGVWMTSDIFHLGADKERSIFVLNFRTAREPAAGNYRTTL